MYRFLQLAALAISGLLAACTSGGDLNIPGPSLPVIASQPTDPSVVEGTPATLTVSAIGAGPLTYQWQSSPDGVTWTNVAGATGATYTTPAVTLGMNGTRYRVIITNALGSTTTSAVRLTVTPSVIAPAITVQPGSQTVTAPAAASFSVTATGTSPAFRWQVSVDAGATFTDVAGATSSTLSIGTTTTTQNGNRYRVVVSNSAGSVTSSAATLTVNPTPAAPAITSQPTSQTITAGSNVNFVVAATGVAAPTLQWRLGGTTLPNGPVTSGGCNGATVAGATSATLTLTSVPIGCSGSVFSVVASNGVTPDATSANATLTVNPAPVAPAITAQPALEVVATAGATAQFTAAASGVPLPTLQWQVSTDGGASFANIVGATGGSYVTPATAVGDEGRRYRLVATNSQGTATSSPGVLYVYSQPTLTNPADTSAFAGQPATFSVTVSGAQGTAQLQWQRAEAGTPGSFVDIPGATTGTYVIATTVVGDNNARFRVRWSNSSNDPAPAQVTNSGTTTAATLTISNPLTATAVVASNSTTMVIRPDGTVWGWGGDVSSTGTYFQSGVTAGTQATQPVQLYPSVLTDVRELTGGFGTWFARLGNGTVVHWGKADNYSDGGGLDGAGGAAGSRGTGEINLTPVQVFERVSGTPQPVDRVCSIRYAYTMLVLSRAISPSGTTTSCLPGAARTVWATGALGGGSLHSNVATLTAGLPDSTVAGASVAALFSNPGTSGNVVATFLAQLEDGRTFVFGWNRQSMLGLASPSVFYTGTMTFTEITSWGTTATSFSFGNDKTIARLADGTLLGAGGNVYYGVGDGSGGPSTNAAVAPPVGVLAETCTALPCGSLLSNVSAVSSSGVSYVTLALRSGQIFAWGGPELNGMTGVATTANFTGTQFPRRVGPLLSGFTAIAAGGNHAIAIGTGGVVYSWGDNTSSALGRGPGTLVVTVPTVVSLP